MKILISQEVIPRHPLQIPQIPHHLTHLLRHQIHHRPPHHLQVRAQVLALAAALVQVAAVAHLPPHLPQAHLVAPPAAQARPARLLRPRLIPPVALI